jgi:hypothetical protein
MAFLFGPLFSPDPSLPRRIVMNLDALILPQHSDNLVLTQPGLSSHLAELFAHLEESHTLRQAFLESPEHLLSEFLGVRVDQSRGTSSANRVLYRLLNTAPPASNAAGPYLGLLRQALAGHSDDAVTIALARGFNVAAVSATEVDVEIVTSEELRLKVAVATELQAQLESKVVSELQAKVATELKAQLETRVAAALKTEIAIDTELRAQLESKIAAELKAQLVVKVATELKAQLETRVAAALKTEIAIDTELRAQLESKIAAELRAQLAVKVATELKAQLETRAALVLKTATELKVTALIQTSLEQSLESELRLNTDIETRAELEAVLEAGLAAAAEGAKRSRMTPAESLSRLDLQRLAGFVAAHPPISDLMLFNPSAPYPVPDSGARP